MVFSSLCATLLLVGGCSASWIHRYKEIFIALDPVSAPWFDSNVISFQEMWYDAYNSYYADVGKFY